MQFKTKRRKQNLGSALGIQKENHWGVIVHFSEIFKFQYGIKSHTLLYILLVF